MSPWEIPRPMTGVRHLVEAATSRGLSADACLAGSGLGASALHDPTLTVAGWQELLVAQNFVTAVPSTMGLGIELGSRLHLTTYGPLGLAFLGSQSLEAALGLARTFSALTLLMSRVQYVAGPGVAEVAFDGTRIPEPVRKLLVERDVAASMMVLREISGERNPVRRLELAFPGDGSARRWLQEFGVVPKFKSTATAIAFESSVVDKPLPQRDQHALWLAMRDCAELLEQRKRQANVASQALDRMWNTAPDLPSLDDLANSLMTTTRTLRRRLAAEGTSYRALIEQVRLSTASSLLAAGRLSVEQIAEHLGYADTSAFTHAFRRWTGQSPRAYRQSLNDR